MYICVCVYVFEGNLSEVIEMKQEKLKFIWEEGRMLCNGVQEKLKELQRFY